ncbi:MAG TPA: Holliday junction branch migration DNA helicase RuvB [Dehalococcoidia bacterium]|nr:Holliday junction branch migration DNA helicase RuvB [Dehalococcoidia bacterium]
MPILSAEGEHMGESSRTEAARVVSGARREDDASLDVTLRPKRLDEYIGQDKVKENLAIAIAAAQARGEPLDHILLYGPPGLGKTTLANVIAHELGVGLRVTSGPAIERAGDLAAILTSLEPHDVLFIDEVHRLARPVEEVLYPAMEDRALDIVLGKGPAARSVRLALPPFTLIGATTRYALLSAPLRDRFGAVFRLDFYDERALATIALRSSSILEVPLESDAAVLLAGRSRGTPRVVNRLLRRVRDYAQVLGDGRITAELAEDALGRLEVDHLGLDEVDHKILRSIIEKFAGGPVGLETIAASISEDPGTVMDVYEPYLLQVGFIQRTPRGRVATQRAYAHLGLEREDAEPPVQPRFWE